MKVGIAQVECVPGDIEANCQKIIAVSERARDEGCEALVFPEMMDTGSSLNAITQHASRWPSQTYEALQVTASRLSLSIACGLAEQEGPLIYNTTALFDENGELVGKYRKIHLFSYEPVSEQRVIAGGESLCVLPVNGMKWGFLTCYDLRFPELARSLVLHGAQTLVVTAAWPQSRIGIWNLLTRARAVEDQTYVIGANRVGADGNTPFGGSSAIISPTGEMLAGAGEENEELVIAEIDKAEVEAVREKMPVLNDRRPELYFEASFTEEKEEEAPPQPSVSTSGERRRKVASEKREKVVSDATHTLHNIALASATSILLFVIFALLDLSRITVTAATTKTADLLMFVGIAQIFITPFIRRYLFQAQMEEEFRMTIEMITAAYVTATIVAFGLWEGVAIYGLVAYMLSGEPLWCYVLGAGSLAAMIWAWPRVGTVRDKILNLVESLHAGG